MPRAKRALERAAREAATLGDGHVGVEHVLLGLLDPRSNMAVELLRHLGANPEVVRVCVLADLGKAV
jgi:ATP-dependent Clp protease ATP-binding subunit ClpA